MKTEPYKGEIARNATKVFGHMPNGCLYVASADSLRDSRGYPLDARWECQPRKDGHTAYLRAMYDVGINIRMYG